MNWTNLWLKLFGTTSWMGIDMGFWVSMTIISVIVILMIVFFWTMKPRAGKNDAQ